MNGCDGLARGECGSPPQVDVHLRMRPPMTRPGSRNGSMRAAAAFCVQARTETVDRCRASSFTRAETIRARHSEIQKLTKADLDGLVGRLRRGEVTGRKKWSARSANYMLYLCAAVLTTRWRKVTPCATSPSWSTGSRATRPRCELSPSATCSASSITNAGIGAFGPCRCTGCDAERSLGCGGRMLT
jgi:hypothetical protein